MPMRRVNGLHHVTSGVWGAQEDIDFFTQVVGQRMIKQTILFDGTVSFYHLYYANANARSLRVPRSCSSAIRCRSAR